MPNREKDQADFDLETFIDLFDTAMTSDNPTVQRAFKNLMLVATIVNAEDANKGLRQGPLRRLVEDMNNISRRLSNVESKNAYSNPYTTTITPGMPAVGIGSPYSNQTWTTTSTTGYVHTNTPPKVASVAGGGTVNYSGYSIDPSTIDQIYKDLESK